MEIKVSEIPSLMADIVCHNYRLSQQGFAAESYTVPFFKGAPGLGKTETIFQGADIAAERLGLDIGKASTIIAQYEPGDLSGLPWPGEEGSTKRLRPDFLKTTGIWVHLLDELSQSAKQCANIIAQLIHQHQIGEHKASAHCFFAAAGNQRQHRSGTVELPRHMLNRLTHYVVAFCLEGLLSHAIARQWDSRVVAFLRVYPQHAMAFDPAQEINATPRMWEQVSRVVGSDDFGRRQLDLTISGKVGESAGHAFSAFLKIADQVGNPLAVFDDPDGFRIPDDIGAKYLLCAALGEHVNRERMPAYRRFLERLERENSHAKELLIMSAQIAHARHPVAFNCQDGQALIARHAESLS